MANYDFGEQILRSIQIQDDINLKKQELGMEQTKFNAQQAQQNREFGLQTAQFQSLEKSRVSQEEGRQFNQNLDIQKFYQQAAEKFNSTYTSADAVPEDVKSKLPQSAGIIKDGKMYFQNTAITNIGASLGRQETAKRDAQTAKHESVIENQGQQNIDIKKGKSGELKLDAPTKTLMGNIDSNFADARKGGVSSKVSQSNVESLTDQLAGRTQITDVVTDVWNDMKNNKLPLSDALKKAKSAYELTPQQETVLDYYFQRRLPTGKMK